MSQLTLTVSVPAEEYAYMQRRIAYLEALLLRIMRFEIEVREWFSSSDLHMMFLPGLPASAAAITRKARTEGWPRRCFRDGKGTVTRFHVSALPPRAFDALIARFLDLPPLDADMKGVFDLPVPPEPAPLPENAAPQWILPLMRILRTEAGGDLGRAWVALPRHVPEGMKLPDAEEAARVLIRLGLA